MDKESMNYRRLKLVLRDSSTKKVNAMWAKTTVLFVSMLFVSAPVFARTFECTQFDEAHWTAKELLRNELVADGNKVVNIGVEGHCYHVLMETADGRKVEGIYNPMGAYPLRRQVR